MTREGERGISLIDLLIMMALGGILLGWTARTLVGTVEASRTHRVQTEVRREFDRAFDLIVRDVQSARRIASGTTTNRLEIVASTGSTVRYELSSDTITREGIPLIRNISSLRVECLDRDLRETTSLDSAIACAVTLKTDGGTSRTRVLTLRSLVAPLAEYAVR